MPEATIVCCDCSEFMRNGDFHPTRFDSQNDAVGLIANAKTQQNHENTVGLISMHDSGTANVLMNCTSDIGRVLSSLGKMCIGDTIGSSKASTVESINILVALQTAQLALKHRRNKKQEQRIILFIGSPITKCQSERQLLKAAKRLKKNNVSVDIVNFGEEDENTELLTKFIEAVNSNENSNLVTVEAGRLLSDVLTSSPLFAQHSNAINPYANLGMSDANVAAGGGANGVSAAQIQAAGGNTEVAQALLNSGIDPQTDPDIAMAIRASLEEERRRLEEEAKAARDLSLAEQKQNEAPTNVAADENADGDAVDVEMDEDDEELLRALQMSMDENEEDEEVPNPNQAQVIDSGLKADVGGDGGKEENVVSGTEVNDELEDDDFIADLMSCLPGLDKEEIDLDAMMQDMEDDDDEDDDVADDDSGEKK